MTRSCVGLTQAVTIPARGARRSSCLPTVQSVTTNVDSAALAKSAVSVSMVIASGEVNGWSHNACQVSAPTNPR